MIDEEMFDQLLALILLTLLALYCWPAPAQTNQTFPQREYYASDYGTWAIQGQYPNTYLFSPPGVCNVPAPDVPAFVPFNLNAPVYLRDAVSANSEVLTPTRVVATASYCGVSLSPVNTHTSFALLSATGGLQEVLNQIPASVSYPVQVILDRNWYTLVNSVPGQVAATVIGAVHGNTAANLVDVTQAPTTYYHWNGSQYVAVGGTASTVNYNQGSAGAVTRTSTSKWQDSISIKDFGATGGNLSLDTAGLQAAVAAAASTGKSVYIPAGTYLLNNSAGPVLSGAQNVLIWGEGPASALNCNTVGGADCLASTGATGFGLMNLSVSFTPTATTRSSGYAVDIETCTGCMLQNVSLNNGDLSGLRLASSVHTSISNLKVSNFYANGTFLINNEDLRVDGLSCQNNQDACFETSWFDSEYTAHSIPCEQITATNITSSNDLEGILVNACRNVSVDGFSIVGSAKESIFVGQDPSTTTLHWPDRVAIGNGAIYGAGYGTNPLNVATAQAVYINVGTNPSGPISHLSFTSIVATHISNWGFQMADFQNDDVAFNNLSLYDVGNGNSTGCFQTEGNNVNFANVSCTDVGTYALFDNNTLSLTGTNFVSVAASQVSGTQAIFLNSTATGFVGINGVNVTDTNASTFSSSIFDDSTSGQHGIFNISTVAHAGVSPLGPTSNNSGTTYSYSDVNHSYVFRNGGTIESFAPPNVYLVPTSGTTGSSQVNGSVLYFQSKCRVSPPSLPELTESIGWLDLYPTLTTESFALNHTGGCSFPIVFDVTAAASILGPTLNDTGNVFAKHLGGYTTGTYASVPTFTGGTGAGTSPTVSMNAASSDVSGFVSVTPGSSPATNAVVVTGTFGTAYGVLAKCNIWPANAAAAALSGTTQVFSPPVSAAAFTITSGSAALTASTLYTWGYSCTQ